MHNQDINPGSPVRRVSGPGNNKPARAFPWEKAAAGDVQALHSLPSY